MQILYVLKIRLAFVYVILFFKLDLTETDSRQWMLGDTDYYRGSGAISEQSSATFSSSSVSNVHQRGDSLEGNSTEQLNSLSTLTEEVFFSSFCILSIALLPSLV